MSMTWRSVLWQLYYVHPLTKSPSGIDLWLCVSLKQSTNIFAKSENALQPEMPQAGERSGVPTELLTVRNNGKSERARLQEQRHFYKEVAAEDQSFST